MFIYNWLDYRDIRVSLQQIYSNTLYRLKDYNEAKEIINQIEDYVSVLLRNGFDEKIISEKLAKVNSVNYMNMLFPNQNHNITKRPVVNFRGNIVINSNSYGDQRLNSEERKRLFLYVGLSKIFLNFNSDEIAKFDEQYNEFDDITPVKLDYITASGWRLFENVLAQELGERITYIALGKDRPNIRVGLEYNDYFPIDGSLVSSRLEMYRMFSDFIPKMAKSLHGVGTFSNHDSESLTRGILRKAINGDISKYIIHDHMAHDYGFELYSVIYLMGRLNIEKEGTFGIWPLPELKLDKYDSKQIIETINSILDGMTTLSKEEYDSIPDITYDNVIKNQFVKARLKRIVVEKKL